MKAFLCAAVLASCAMPVFGEDFPLTITHKFGTTEIPQKPIRIATVDYAGADDLLALGIQPVAYRYWYGDHAEMLWPWASPLLQGEAEVLVGALDFEQIARAEPDIILSLWSGIDQNEYDQLSQIAPVVAVPPGVGDYALPWDERARIAGRAIGLQDAVDAKIASIEQKLAEVAAAHPEWDGLTAAVGFVSDGVGAYTETDVRPQLLSSLGFKNPQAVADLAAPGAFSVRFSQEDLSPLDADLLIWIDAAGNFQPVEDLVARPFLKAAQDGREVFMGKDMTGAFSHASLLSLPYAIDRMAPMFAAALDGDPTTYADDR